MYTIKVDCLPSYLPRYRYFFIFATKYRQMDANFSQQNGLIQVVIQDARTNKVLSVGYANEETYRTMINSNMVYLLKNGKPEQYTAGEYHTPVSINSIICAEDGASIVIKALPEGSTTGADTFLGEKNMEDLTFLSHLQDFIEKRKLEMPEGSYTTKLFSKGVNKISQKVGEEAIETIIEATNGTKDQLLYEASDLIYHLIVLLTEKKLRIEDVARELKARHKE